MAEADVKPYYQTRLEDDLAQYEEWLDDEITRYNRAKDSGDTEWLPYGQIRIDMYKKGIQDIKIALENLSKAEV